jgi:hypothetical protein
VGFQSKGHIYPIPNPISASINLTLQCSPGPVQTESGPVRWNFRLVRFQSEKSLDRTGLNPDRSSPDWSTPGPMKTLFVIGTDSGLWQISSTDGGGNWNSWSGKGGKWIAAPEVTSWGRDRYDIFLLGTDSRLFHARYNGSWSEFFDLGGTIIKPPTAVSWSKNRLDVFVIGTNGAMYHKWSSGNGSWGPSQFGYEDLRGISITAVGWRCEIVWVLLL